jgi:putative CocE/NonD family hydrolase
MSLYAAVSRKLKLPAPRVAKVKCRRGEPVRMPDGTTLLTDHWTPVGVDNPPVMLIRTPYGRRMMNLLVGRYFAHQGFRVLNQACRGTDGSEGVFDDPFVAEIDDGKAMVAWLTGQPWYPGSFVTFGDSYIGYSALCAASAAGDHLSAAVLRVAPSSLHDMLWTDGSHALGSAFGWALLANVDPTLGFKAILRERKNAPRIVQTALTTPFNETYRTLSGGPIGFYDGWITHESNDDGWWDRGEIADLLDTIKAPVLVQTGWYDLFLEDCGRQFARLHKNGTHAELTIGPWTHGEVLSKGLSQTITEATSFLRDVTGMEPHPAPRAAVRLLEIGSDASVGLDSWPVVAATELTLHLDAGGKLRTEPVKSTGSATSTFRYDPADPTPSIGGATNASKGAGAADNAELEARVDVLTFTSEPLAEDIHLVGSPSVALRMDSDREQTAVFLRLCVVGADGKSTNFTDRLTILRRRDRDADGGWDVSVTLPPTCIAIPAGSAIRLQVSSGAYPRFMRHPGTTESSTTTSDFLPATQTIHHDADHPALVTLPLRATA